MHSTIDAKKLDNKVTMFLVHAWKLSLVILDESV